MEFPIFPNPWNASCRPLRSIPVQVNPKATQPQSLKPKVVSIPVLFDGSEQSGSSQPIIKMDRSESAIKIQKVFKGYLVRRNMGKIKAIREEVNTIERNVSKTETIDLIRNDSKERLKVNEMLMSVLLKLDSIRGVDSGVRDCRRSVIKKAIALQERVDAIISGDQQSVDTNNADTVYLNQSHDVITDSADNSHETSESQNHDRDNEMINECHDEFLPNLSESEVIAQNQETVDESNDKEDAANQGQEEDEDEKGTETSRSLSQTDSSANPEPEIVVEQDEAASAAVDEDETYCQPDCEIEKEGNNNEEDKRSKEMLRRIMEDNEKMMGLMQVLYERNEMQTRLVSALTQRVELLEKAFMFDKLRKKKSRSSAAAPVDCGAKKCGER